MEGRLKFGPVVRLDRLDPERELIQQEVRELDGGLLVEPVIDPQDPQAGAVIDGGELVVLLPAGGAQRGDELHVDLDRVARHRLLVAFPLAVVALAALGGREAAEVQALEDPPHAGVADLDVVVAPEVHGDLRRPEVVVLAQVDDLLDDLGGCLVRAVRRPGGAVPQPGQALGLVAAVPDISDRRFFFRRAARCCSAIS